MLNNYGNHYLFSEFKWRSISLASSISAQPRIPPGICRHSYKKLKAPYYPFYFDQLLLFSLFIFKSPKIKEAWKLTILLWVSNAWTAAMLSITKTSALLKGRRAGVCSPSNIFLKYNNDDKCIHSSLSISRINQICDSLKADFLQGKEFYVVCCQGLVDELK